MSCDDNFCGVYIMKMSSSRSTPMVARNYPFNSDGSEELTNGGETREKFNLLFSLFPPSIGIVRGNTLHEGVYSDFGDG